ERGRRAPAAHPPIVCRAQLCSCRPLPNLRAAAQPLLTRFTLMPLADRNVAKGSLLLPTLAMASMLGMVASSIYVASIPEMALAFGTSVGAVQLSYVGYLAALAGGMLVLGPLSDRYGRRLTICLGLLIFVLTSLVCIVSPNVELLNAARVVQGCGACAGNVVGRAIGRD